MALHLRLVLCLVVTVAMALLVTITAIIVLDTSKEQADQFEQSSKDNTKAVNKAGRDAVEDAVELVQGRTNAVIASGVRDYLSVAYIPVEMLRRRIASGDLGLSTAAQTERFRDALWVTMKSLPDLRWFYVTTYPNGEWVAYERIIMEGDACNSYESHANDGRSNHLLCRNGEQFNWMVHDECCAPTMPGSTRYHYVPVNTETGVSVGRGIKDVWGVPRYDWAAHERFGNDPYGGGGPDWDGFDNGTFCCGYTALHVDVTQDPVPRELDQAWRQPFLWTTQYLIGWNAAMYLPNGRYLGVISAEFSLEYLGNYLRSLRRPQFQSEDFFLLDARDGGGAEDEVLIASSCLRTGDGEEDNRCGLDYRTNATDPSAGWEADDKKGFYLGAADPDGDTWWSPIPMWQVADRQGGIARALQQMAWDSFPTASTVPKWNTTSCKDWCGGNTRDRSWSEIYKRHPPHQDGPTSTNGWSGTFDFQGAERFVTVSALRLGDDKARRGGHPAPDGAGVLRWVVISTVKSIEYMRGIEAATATAEVNTQRQTDKMMSELDDARDLTIIIVVCVGFAILVLTFAMVYLMTLPLRLLATDMHSAAVMDLDDLGDGSDGMSAFTEVKELQKSFFAMVKSLKELRNYMPQSALVHSDDEEEAEKGKEQADKKLEGSQSKLSGSRMSGSARSSAVGSRQSKATKQQQQKTAAHGEMGVKTKPCSILAINLRGWLAATTARASEGVSMHGKYVSAVLSLMKSNKGICEPFVGDRLVVHFGALTPCTASPAKACTVAYTLSEKDLGSVAGVCYAKTACGNIGVDGMKRFSLVGGSLPCAVLLAGIAKRKDLKTLTDQGTYDEACKFFYFKSCTRVSFPKFKQHVFTAWQIMAPKASSEDEWMYQMEEAEARDPYTVYNKAFKSLFSSGDPGAMPSDGDAADWMWLRQVKEEKLGGAGPEKWAESVEAVEVM
eukprot:TRINITY_DN1039_c0_g1_i1.p1 TRINITY_DN1039_c0_g1~~TRINITY_DN1039_c0_g1_i1.p1  ORF type:complete len:953 (+),score=291.52 TRINITY_DN1039_c0_g1_i1:111-2969(+)